MMTLFVFLLTLLSVNFVNQDCFSVLVANIDWPGSDYTKLVVIPWQDVLPKKERLAKML